LAGCCHDDHCSGESAQKALNSPSWRRALWIALAVNAVMFAAEIVAGVAAGSASLQADALDFLGDTGTYAISLMVAGLGLGWRARAALLKGGGLLTLGLWVIGSTVWHALAGTLPEAEVMGVVGVLALLANAAVALMLFRFRTGDANMRSVWICSRNDAVNNVLVIAAGGVVYGSGSGVPDLVVAFIMAALAISGGWQVTRQSIAELRRTAAASDGSAPAREPT